MSMLTKFSVPKRNESLCDHDGTYYIHTESVSQIQDTYSVLLYATMKIGTVNMFNLCSGNMMCMYASYILGFFIIYVSEIVTAVLGVLKHPAGYVV